MSILALYKIIKFSAFTFLPKQNKGKNGIKQEIDIIFRDYRLI